MKKVGILGAGAWGTAMATVLAHNGVTVILWSHEQEVVDDIKKNRQNSRYLPGVILSPLICPTNSLQEVFADTQWIFEAIPMAYLRSVLERATPFATSQHAWVLLTKGIEQNTLLLPSEVLCDVLGRVKNLVLVGPSFAHDLARQQITAVVVATDTAYLVQELQDLLKTDYFFLFASTDVKGTQLAAALKNVVALGMGMLTGSGNSDNTKAFFLVLCLAEMKNIIRAYSGHEETIDGLAGVGDLVLTTWGKHSKNVAFGKMLATMSLTESLAQLPCAPEGLNTTLSVGTLLKQKKLSSPVFEGIIAVVQEKLTVQQFLKQIF